MAWVTLEFSRSQIDKAGRILGASEETASSDEIAEARRVLGNWRGSHGFPLNAVQMLLRSRAKKAYGSALISQRLKREVSILKKLSRISRMRLCQMQDIGGCRAVLQTNHQVYRVLEKFSPASLFDENRRKRDYIDAPAPSGYRSIHVFETHIGFEMPRGSVLAIEVQIRTQLQHSWATAVETVDTFLGTDLKSGDGPAEWKRLFALASTTFAAIERSAPVPGTPESEKEARDEIVHLTRELGLFEKLKTWRQAVHLASSSEMTRGAHLLLQFRPDRNETSFEIFPENSFSEALHSYFDLEKSIVGVPRAQTVLVAATSLKGLRRSYPNYFADTTLFESAMKKVLKAA